MLDIDQINSLPNDVKAAYMRHEKTFQSDGWEDIVKWAQDWADVQQQRILNAATWEEALVARGARLAFLALVTLRDTTENEFAHIAAEAAVSVTQDEELENE